MTSWCWMSRRTGPSTTRGPRVLRSERVYRVDEVYGGDTCAASAHARAVLARIGDSDKGLSPLVVSRGDHRSRTVSQYLSPRPSTRGTGALPGSVWMQYAPE